MVFKLIHTFFYLRTTEIHRASLPSDEIAALDETPITFTIDVGIFIENDDRQKEVMDELEVFFRNNDIFNAKLIAIKLDPTKAATIKTPAKLEKVLTETYAIKPGNLLIAEWSSLEDEILVTSERTLFISPKACEHN